MDRDMRRSMLESGVRVASFLKSHAERHIDLVHSRCVISN
jgi:hypothetical protein